MWLFALFLAVPLIEIGLFIKVGGWLTLWPTLGIVLATGVLGTFLVHRQGRQVLADLRGAMATVGNPLSPLAHGALVLFAGALLLTPGFFTDTIGLLLLIPAVRHVVIAQLAARVRVESAGFGHGAARQGDVIDGEFIDVEAEERTRPGTSGWTRH